MTFLPTDYGAPFSVAGSYNASRGWCAAAGMPRDRSSHGRSKACGRRLAEAGCTALAEV
jgi:hypothetical protein